MKARLLRSSLVVSVATLLAVSSVYALPFNSDMVNNQLRAGAIMRPLPEGSIAVGSLVGRLEKRDDALALSNPIKSDAVSIGAGQRLFAANCYPCHGDLSQKTWIPGPVGQKMTALVPGKPPELTNAYYKGQPDGVFYAAMHFGFGLMPNVGWKLSPTEHWDIINYIRSVQASK